MEVKRSDWSEGESRRTVDRVAPDNVKRPVHILLDRGHGVQIVQKIGDEEVSGDEKCEVAQERVMTFVSLVEVRPKRGKLWTL